MCLSKPLATGAVSLALLATMSGCGSDSDSGPHPASASAAAPEGGSLPSAKSLEEAQDFIAGAGLPCTDITTDEGAQGTPVEGFLGHTDEDDTAKEQREAAAWSIKEAGFCGDTRSDLGGWVVYLPKDMKAFQENYRDTARESAKEEGWAGRLSRGKFLIGADFIVDPTNYEASDSLLQTGLMIENCDPDFKAPDGYRTQDASADGCVLTNYLSAG
ncbi:hypothetical protein ACIRPU_13335 [Streptomyces sp. NPDC102259]|uniref:hypothetical protein n=1 Tax=Streptomyces sp. NPDC102259 TaxID=3366148 RepID=UPI003818401E